MIGPHLVWRFRGKPIDELTDAECRIALTHLLRDREREEHWKELQQDMKKTFHEVGKRWQVEDS